MKVRETNLKLITSEIYGEGNNQNSKGSILDLSDTAKKEIIRMYQSLGGILVNPPTRFGSWDIITPNFIIEFDEEQHFNRYRYQTLQSNIYLENSNFTIENYKQFCTIYENNCLQKANFGKYWTSPSTEKQFGKAGLRGDFSMHGSPRWKQRAYYDFCKDLFAIEFGFKLIRLSIYDKVKTNNGFIDLGLALEKGLKTDVINFLKNTIDGK